MKVPAKINLYLHVNGKRPDGYHLLNTLIVFTDIHDEIYIDVADKFSMEISGPFAHLVENNEKNIVARSLRMMAKESGHEDNVSIKLVKNIPVGAGMGGGSGNSAATIILLNELWNLGFSTDKLKDIGLRLGADVPVFIGRESSFVSGIGEKLQNTGKLPELYAILVYPNKPLSTKDIFTDFAKTSPTFSNELPENIDCTLSFIKAQKNDLTNAATNALPEIKSLLERLSTLPECEFARMSGSGSSCFAIFADKEQSDNNVMQLRKEYPTYWIKSCSLLTNY